MLRVFAAHESRALYRDRVLAPPRCDGIAAWRLCFAKISVSKIFAAQVGGSKFQRQTANATNFPQCWATRVASQTLHGAYALLKFLFSKNFADQVGGKTFQRQTANAPNGRLAFKTRRSSHASLKLSRPQRRNRSNSMKLPPLACRYRITLLTCPGCATFETHDHKTRHVNKMCEDAWLR